MKVDEFEEKLTKVTEARLRQMLAASRANGPEVAVKLILAEGNRRGLDLEANANDFGPRISGAETMAYPQEHAGYGGSDAPPAQGAPVATETAPEPEAADAASPAPPEWLSEETKSGLPLPVKLLIVVVILAGILFTAWKFTH